MLIDSHCHLDYLAREGDLDGVVARAREAGVKLMVTISTRVTEFDAVRAIAERYDDVYCSVGVHPHEAATEPEMTPDHLVRLARHPKVVAIGETGLDFFYEHSPRAAQITAFRAHIAAARESGLPLIVHSREADAETADILAAETGEGAFPGLIHCFTGGPGLARRALDLGLYISLSGILTFKKAEALRDIARDLPADRILIETDSPYLAPVPMRGKRNEPAYVGHTAAALAALRATDADAIAATTAANFFRLFAKVARPR